MASSLITTPESERNSFLDLEEAEELLALMFGVGPDAWAAASEGTKDKVLAQASADLSDETWAGVESDGEEQAMAWPRRLAGVCSDGVGIPVEVKRAALEQAFFYLTGRYKDQIAQGDGLSSVGGRGFSTSFRGRSDRICWAARRLLNNWELGGAGIR